MAQIKIEITYDPSTETLAQAVSSLVPQAAASTTTAAPAAVGKSEQDKPATTTEPEVKPQETSAAATTGRKPEEKPVSKTDVRAMATVLSKAGKREQLSAIFAEFGGKKLSDIKEEDYPALMKKLEAANG